MFSLLLPTILQMEVMLIRKQLVIRPAEVAAPFFFPDAAPRTPNIFTYHRCNSNRLPRRERGGQIYMRGECVEHYECACALPPPHRLNFHKHAH